jgi:hypothetical protein
MTWIRIDDNFPDHPKIIGLSNLAFRTHIQGLCYCGRFLTDGFIPFAAINSMITEPENKPTDELESAGLWVRDDKGFHILNYQEYQSTKAEVEVIKARNRERTQKWREKNKGNADVTRNQQNSNSNVTVPHTPIHTHTPIPNVVIDPVYQELAQYLAQRITDNGSKTPTVTHTWINDIRLMVERDGRSVEQIRYIIDWCQTDSFWRSNIFSPSKLRSKFDQLRLNADLQSVRKVPQGEAFLKEFLSTAATGAIQKELE